MAPLQRALRERQTSQASRTRLRGGRDGESSLIAKSYMYSEVVDYGGGRGAGS